MGLRGIVDAVENHEQVIANVADLGIVNVGFQAIFNGQGVKLEDPLRKVPPSSVVSPISTQSRPTPEAKATRICSSLRFLVSPPSGSK